MRRTSQLGVVALAVLLVASAIGGGVVPVSAQQDGEDATATPTETETAVEETETAAEETETTTETPTPEPEPEAPEAEAPTEEPATETAEPVTETEAPATETEAPATEAPGEETPTEAAGPTVIDSCTVIDEPGRYVLAENLTDAEGTAAAQNEDVPAYVANVAACIWIRSDDVTLDGSGNLVSGTNDAEPVPDVSVNESDDLVQNATGEGNASTGENVTTYSAGVAVVPPSENETLENVTVSNLTATDWYGGVLVTNATESVVEGVTATDNAFAGVTLYEVTGSVVANTTANENGYGIVDDGSFVDGGNNAFADNEARNNSAVGVFLLSTDGNLLSGNVVAGNELSGITLVRSDGDRLIDNRIVDTRGNESLYRVSGGLLLFNSRELVAVNTTASDNRRWTVYATNGSTFSMSRAAVGSRTVSIRGTDVAVAETEAFAESSDANVTAVGDGLVATNTSEDNSSLLIGVRWIDSETAAETPVTPDPSAPEDETETAETTAAPEEPETATETDEETEASVPETDTPTPADETETETEGPGT